MNWEEMTPQEVYWMILEKIFEGPISTVECDNCHEEIHVDDAYAVLTSTFVCDPKLSPECLWQWNNEGFVRSEFYD